MTWWTHLVLAATLAGALVLGMPQAGAQESSNSQQTNSAQPIVIGSKTFTESVILGEIITQLARSSGAQTRHFRQLGGTRILWNAVIAGEIDLYVDYTGTLLEEVLAGENLTGPDALPEALAAHGLALSAALGFNNTYAIGMRRETAARYAIATISDLVGYPDLAFGFSNEFIDRADGWPNLRRHYGLPQKNVHGLDHDLAYRGLEAGAIDVMELYTTDAEIAYYGLAVLADDRGYFPDYAAVLVYRADLAVRAPEALAAILRLEGQISAPEMAALNARAKIDGMPEATVARDFLAARFGLEIEVETETWRDRLIRNGLTHLKLVAISLGAALVTAIPLGIFAARRARIGQIVLGLSGLVQTIPALAMFVFMIPLLGIGAPPTIAALFLYSLLPIVRNTHAGLTGIAGSLLESADALGLPRTTRLLRIELPLAAPAILSGIKTSAVINVGAATLGALIGAGGFGEPILTGIRLDDIGLILEGAIPAAALALLVQGLFDLLERWIVPRGLRLRVE